MDASAGGGGKGIDWTSLLLAGGMGVANGIANAKAKKGDRAFEAEQQRKALEAKAFADRQGVAADESKLDPFRQQMSQATDLAALDRMERGTYSPVRLSGASDYAKYAPNVSGGFSYEKSPELIQSAGMLKRNIMGGNVAPTMTDPNNYGNSAALNILQIMAAGKDPGQVSASGGPSSPTGSLPLTTDYLADVPRRNVSGGGAVKGAVGGAMTGASVGSVVPGVGTAIGLGAGALAGGIKGLFNKHASSAATDVTVADAQNVLDRAIREQLRRAPMPGEIAQLLASQGLKPGDRWVGNAGLTGLLSNIRAQSAGQAAATPSFTGRG